MNRLVSVIITTYNRSKYLQETLVSISNQSYQEIEIIVVDDGSNAIVANEVKQLCNKFPKCQYFWKNNTGQPDSRNYGIRRAKGEFIAFCDDDDFWVLDKLQKQIEVLEKNPDFDVVTGCIEYIDCKGKSLLSVKCHTGFNHGYIFENLLSKNRTDAVTPLLRKTVFEKSGFFNPTFTIAEDWEFWRRVAYYHKFYALDEVLAYVRRHETNMTVLFQNTVVNRISVLIKLNKELRSWGKTNMSYEDFFLVDKYERQECKRLISNHYNSKLDQIRFLLSFIVKKPMEGLYLLNLLFFKKTSL